MPSSFLWEKYNLPARGIWST